MTTQHRKCGCDCNDQTRWVEDTGILQATFDCGCADNAKPPCVYYANFECSVDATGDRFPFPFDGLTLRYSRGVPTFAVELRPTCKWGPVGRYVSLKNSPIDFNSYTVTRNEAAFSGSCTWDDLMGLGNNAGAGVRLQAPWNALESRIQWTLMIASPSATMTHYAGATYSQKSSEIWDCFGPNTLWLDKDPSEYSTYATLPKFVCVTPTVFAAKNPPTSCSQCYGVTIPSISTSRGYILSQKLQFLRAGIEYGSTDSFNGGAPITGDFMQAPFLFQWVYGIANHGGLVAQDQFSGGRNFAVLHFLDPIQANQTSRATITFPDDGVSRVNQANAVGYNCDQFSCGQSNVFSISAAVAGWPATLTLDPEDCTRSDQYQWGPCWKSLGYTGWEAGYPSGESEESRKDCCDPWCSCAPGWLKVFNPSGSHLYQSFGGLTTNPTSSTAFCAGGRYGLNSPSNISREWCLPTVYAADGTTHQICMVLYCGSQGSLSGGSTWYIDWYCDGTFVATRNMNQVMSCCPNQMAQTGPPMPCLPGAVLCVGINVEPTCEPLCCTNQPNTLYVTFTSTCPRLTGQSVALTKTGDNYWLNPFVFSGFYIIDLRCNNGNWTLGIYATGCTTYLYSNQIKCEPFIFGNFGPITLTCVGPLCSVGDTVSVVLST